MSFEVSGKLHKVFETENKSATFQAREFVIEVQDGNYPQFVKFQLVQDRCALIDDFAEGEAVNVFFDLRGREWNGKYFTNLNAWRVEKPAAAQPQAPAGEASTGFPTATDEPPEDPNVDDLPF